jgi:2-oxoglutarate dehydrogenase E2 component (dihydrolipoamide succinyltransferase)
MTKAGARMGVPMLTDTEEGRVGGGPEGSAPRPLGGVTTDADRPEGGVPAGGDFTGGDLAGGVAGGRGPLGDVEEGVARPGGATGEELPAAAAAPEPPPAPAPAPALALAPAPAPAAPPPSPLLAFPAGELGAASRAAAAVAPLKWRLIAPAQR